MKIATIPRPLHTPWALLSHRANACVGAIPELGLRESGVRAWWSGYERPAIPHRYLQYQAFCGYVCMFVASESFVKTGTSRSSSACSRGFQRTTSRARRCFVFSLARGADNDTPGYASRTPRLLDCQLSRRTLLQLLGCGLLAVSASPAASAPYEKSKVQAQAVLGEPQGKQSWATRLAPYSSDTIYRLATSGEHASVLAVDEEACLDALARSADLVLVGDHPRSQTDHAMEARIVAALALRVAPNQDYSQERSSLAVASDAFEQAHQSHLDDFIQGRIQEEELYERTKWDERCMWPYERYLNLLRTCRSLGVNLVALSMQNTHRKALEKQGLRYLQENHAVRRLYFPEREGICDELVQYASSPAYRLFASQVLEPFFMTMRRYGSTDPDVSFASFSEAALVQDAAMAAVLRRWMTKRKRHPRATASRCRLLACCELPHVAFGQGIRGMLEWWQKLDNEKQRAQHGTAGATVDAARPATLLGADPTDSVIPEEGPTEPMLSIQTLVLNPTVVDVGSRTVPGTERRDLFSGRRIRRLRLELPRNMMEESPLLVSPKRAFNGILDAEPKELHASAAQTSAPNGDASIGSSESPVSTAPLVIGDYLWISASKKGRIQV